MRSGVNTPAVQEKSGHHAPAAAHKGSDVGNETKAATEKAINSDPMGGNAGHLARAVHELHSQHPIAHHDHGPHHGTTHHIRHEPMHGMKVHKR